MSMNLSVGHFRNGEEIPHCESDEDWIAAANNALPAWCHCDGDAQNGANYGRLYNWFAVTDPRGLVPDGWAMLGREELLDWVRSEGETALPGIRTVNLIRVNSPKTKTNDHVEFLRRDVFGYWWLPTEYPKYNNLKGDIAYRSSQQPLELNSGLYFMEKGNGLSVRCMPATTWFEKLIGWFR